MPNNEFDKTRPLVLCILDGWGENEEEDNNAIAIAETPILDKLRNTWPNALLNTSSSAVGLPHGQVGNSEVGHACIGAGRVIPQDLTRINESIESDTLKLNPDLLRLTESIQKTGGSCHLLGLLSSGGVHSHKEHICALAQFILLQGIPVVLHVITDGRDTPPKHILTDCTEVLNVLSEYPHFTLGTVSGRFYAMDRDKRWGRIEKAWRAIQLGSGETSDNIQNLIKNSYAAGITDEFILPTVIKEYNGVKNGDGLLVANFRADRIREILTALVEPGFNQFLRPEHAKFHMQMGMVSYSEQLDKVCGCLFPPVNIEDTLGQVVSDAGLSQLRIAETEKYAHVTFFFNGGREKFFNKEERIMVPSPNVRTYDLKPEMSAVQLTDKLVSAITDNLYDLIVVNFANGDMVGHTGLLKAAINAVETVDSSIGRIENAIHKLNGLMLITADHGNCETMVDRSNGQPHTSHTKNPVPIILVGAPTGVTKLVDGGLSDVAPTILELLKLEIPESMTGSSLLRGPATRTNSEKA